MRTIVGLGFVLVVASPAVAEEWPLLHEVLEHQRQLPCRETWNLGTDDVTFTMTFDRRGRLARRVDDSSGAWWKYRYDSRGRIVAVEGEQGGGTPITQASTVRHGKRGLVSIVRKTRTEVSGLRLSGEPAEFRDSVLELTRIHEDARTVRVRATFTGESSVEDVMHFEKGRLVSIDTYLGEVMTFAYDADGRLLTRTTSDAGKVYAVSTYTYDTKGRLVREEFDRAVDGVVDQSHAYEYDCKGP